MFENAIDEAPADYWAPDGVHPSPAGHYRMAQVWIQEMAASIDRKKQD